MKYSRTSFLIFLFSLSFSTSILSQNKIIDSLENELAIRIEKDTTRVNNLDHLAFLYYRKDITKALEFMEESEALAEEINYGKGMANAIYTRGVVEMSQSNFDVAIKHFENASQLYAKLGLKSHISGCYNGMGVIYYYQSDYDPALSSFEKALQIDEEVGKKSNIPNYITNIGNIYLNTGRYPEALKNFKKGLEIYTESKNELGTATSIKNIGLVYQSQGNYPLALEYNNKALLIAEKIQDSSGISFSFNNIGIIYKQQGNYDKALEFFGKTLEIQKTLKNDILVAATKNNIATVYISKEELVTAIKFLEESLAINRKINSKAQIAESLNNLGYVHVSLKKYTAGFKYYEEAKNINIEIDNQKGLSYSYLGIADSYMEQKLYDQALVNVLKSLEISKKLNLLDDQKDAYKLLSKIYKTKGQYKQALISHEQFKIFNDSLFNKENIEKIAQLEYEYKYKQELELAGFRELKLTETVKKTSQDLEKSQRNLLLGVIAILMVSLVLGSIIFFLKLRNVKSYTQNIVIEQKLLRSQMTPHFIFNSLSVLQGMILNKEEKKSVTYLSRFSKLLRIILENSRDKTVLLSQELDAIENYLALQNLENQSYIYTVKVDEAIDIQVVEIPPMLIQPFVENAIEHGFLNQKENRKIDIHLKDSDKKLVCTIIDNGIGVDAKKENKKSHKKSLATTITSERLRMVSKDFKTKGSILIEDRNKYNEKGTIVTLVIPYKLNKAT